MQYAIILLLEKYVEVSIESLSELLGVTDINYLMNECNGLFCHPQFNIKKLSKNGLILTTAPEGSEITKKEEKIKLNKDFLCNNIKLTTLPVSVKVKIN
jgi:hypothetical protein